MGWYEAIIVLHVIGAAVGVGAAATSDSVFLGSIRNRMISHDQFLLIRKSSSVVLYGLVLLVLSGIALLFYNVDLWRLPHFQAKMSIVIILMINGIVFHAKVLPVLEQNQQKTMSEEFISSKKWLLSIPGSISVVSWFGALIIAVIGHVENITFGYFAYMGVFLFLVIAGSFVANFLLTHIVIGKAEPESVKARKSKGEKVSIVVLIAMLLLLVISLVLLVLRPGQENAVGFTEEQSIYQPFEKKIDSESSMQSFL